MKKLAIFVGALSALGAFPAAAADLVIDAPVVIADSADDSGWYFEFLGGAALPGVIEHRLNGVVNHTHNVGFGPAVAAVIGYEIADNFSIELDAMVQARKEPAGYHTTASLMAGVRYTLDVSDGFSVHAGAAVGAIMYADGSVAPAQQGTGLGYQLKLGATAKVAESISLVGEVRYQAPFTPMAFSPSPGWTSSFGTATVLGGIKIGF